MSWQKLARLAASLVVASLAATTMTSIASAASGQPIHRNFDVTAPESWCDLTNLIGHHVGAENFWPTSSPAGIPMFRFTGNDTHTITNPANGRSVIWFNAGQESDVSAVWTAPDTYRVTTFYDGSAERLTLPDGTHLSADVGRIVFYNDLNDHGTPTDFSDDYPIDSGGITFQAGPHPDGDANGAVLCSILDTYLK